MAAGRGHEVESGAIAAVGGASAARRTAKTGVDAGSTLQCVPWVPWAAAFRSAGPARSQRLWSGMPLSEKMAPTWGAADAVWMACAISSR